MIHFTIRIWSNYTWKVLKSCTMKLLYPSSSQEVCSVLTLWARRGKLSFVGFKMRLRSFQECVDVIWHPRLTGAPRCVQCSNYVMLIKLFKEALWPPTFPLWASTVGGQTGVFSFSLLYFCLWHARDGSWLCIPMMHQCSCHLTPLDWQSEDRGVIGCLFLWWLDSADWAWLEKRYHTVGQFYVVWHIIPLR